MVEKAAIQSVAKGGTLAADMAARPFQCEWHQGCPKSFNRKSDLQRHYRIHTNTRPYACDYKPCNKTFIQRSALTVHRRTHTGDKPHKCPFVGCGKCFSDSSSLARHRRIHTNDKPYICRNQRCKKAFCRKTTMTKHIRKEHAAEPIQEDQDAEYSDLEPSDDDALEDDTEDGREDAKSLYQDSGDSISQVARPSSNYHTSLWRLPAQTAQGPSPLQLLLRSEIPIQEIKLERSTSRTPQRSMTDPYPNTPMHSSAYSQARTDTIPDHMSGQSTLPQTSGTNVVPPQFQLRTHDNNVDIWSPQSLQDSPTSLTHSSPGSGTTQSRSMFTSQPYRFQAVDLPSHEQMAYTDAQENAVQNSIQQLNINQSQQHQFRDMTATPVQRQPPFEAVAQHMPQQDSYPEMPREASQHPSYIGTPSQAPPQNYQDELPSTPASTQQLQQYSFSLQEPPYQPPEFVAPESYSIPNQYFPASNGIYTFSDNGIDWLNAIKPEEDYWTQMPSQRIQDF